MALSVFSLLDAAKVEKKFEDAIKGFSKNFLRINHAYFRSNTAISFSCSNVQSKLRNDDTYFERIDNNNFDVGVQIFSNIDRIIIFIFKHDKD